MIPCLLTKLNYWHQKFFTIKPLYIKLVDCDCSKSKTYNCFLADFLDCHTALNQSHGDITSLGFPQGYYNNMDCVWLIQRPHGEVIEIRFISFDVEPDLSNFVCK